MSNTKAVAMATIGRGVLVAAQHTTQRAIASAQIVAGRALDFERLAFDHATRTVTGRAGRRGMRIQRALNDSAEAIDSGLRRVIADVANVNHVTALTVAGLVDELAIKRVEEAAGGGLVRSIERIAMPSAEALLAAAQVARGLSDRVHDALHASVSERKLKVSRAGRRTSQARRRR